ncbi:MAG: hypothetical protein V4671_12445 [Armatimonadota bacterium]
MSLAIRRVTAGPRSHFFGYYEKSPWDISGRYLLALEANFSGQRPAPDDTAVVGMVDLQDSDRWIPLAKTRAWNWQQGAMLQWRPESPDEILYNDRRDGQFVGIIRNVFTGSEQVVSRPFYGVSPNGRDAVSLNFSRLAQTHPACGYAGIPDPWADTGVPADDGAYHTDLDSGQTRLILSLADAVRAGERWGESPVPGTHWFNHAQFNTDGSRFGLLHRWSDGTFRWKTRLLTLAPDGSDPFVLLDEEMVSHYDWRDRDTILAWARRPVTGDHYYTLTDRDRIDNGTVLGDGVLTVDGHCSYSPDRRWILTDTYPDKDGYRTLILFDPKSEQRIDIGRFHGPSPRDVELRCDLHPRWSRDGRLVCIDSLHENGDRQVYVLDVSAVT